MNSLVTAGAVVVGVGIAAWLLRRFSGTEEIDRSVLEGKDTGLPPGVSRAEADEEEDAAAELDDLLEPEQTLAVSSHGEVFVPFAGQVHVLPLGDVRERIASGVTSWDSVRGEVVEALQIAATTGHGTQLGAGDFTGGRVKRGAPGVDPWRLELLGREGEYVVYVFETEEAAKDALAMLEESEVIRRPLDESGAPIPPSTEDFEEARRRYDETISELSVEPDESGEDPLAGGGGGARARLTDDPSAARSGDEAAAIENQLEIDDARPEEAARSEQPLPERALAVIDEGEQAAEEDTRSPLPAPEGQDWLLDTLAALIHRAGPEPFLCAPLVTPSDSFFPDPWRRDQESVRRIADRLLGYARLDGYRAEIRLSSEALVRPGETERPETSRRKYAIALLEGIEGRLCRFAVMEWGLGQPEMLAGAVAHEVARAWSRVRGMEPAPDREQDEADVTALYLGFGLLTANAAYHYEQSGSIVSARAFRSRYLLGGFLSPQAMCFLLATQAVVCDLPQGSVRRWLETTQKEYFAASTEALAPRLDELIERLGLPPEDQWPEPWGMPGGGTADAGR